MPLLLIIVALLTSTALLDSTNPSSVASATLMDAPLLTEIDFGALTARACADRLLPISTVPFSLVAPVSRIMLPLLSAFVSVDSTVIFPLAFMVPLVAVTVTALSPYAFMDEAAVSSTLWPVPAVTLILPSLDSIVPEEETVPSEAVIVMSLSAAILPPVTAASLAAVTEIMPLPAALLSAVKLDPLRLSAVSPLALRDIFPAVCILLLLTSKALLSKLTSSVTSMDVCCTLIESGAVTARVLAEIFREFAFRLSASPIATLPLVFPVLRVTVPTFVFSPSFAVILPRAAIAPSTALMLISPDEFKLEFLVSSTVFVVSEFSAVRVITGALIVPSTIIPLLDRVSPASSVTVILAFLTSILSVAFTLIVAAFTSLRLPLSGPRVTDFVPTFTGAALGACPRVMVPSSAFNAPVTVIAFSSPLSIVIASAVMFAPELTSLPAVILTLVVSAVPIVPPVLISLSAVMFTVVASITPIVLISVPAVMVMVSSAVKLPRADILPVVAVIPRLFAASSPEAVRAEPLFKVTSPVVAVKLICLALIDPLAVIALPLREIPSSPVIFTRPEDTVMLLPLDTATESALKAAASVPPPPKVTLLPASLTESMASSLAFRTVVPFRVRSVSLSTSKVAPQKPEVLSVVSTLTAPAARSVSALMVLFAIEVFRETAVTVSPFKVVLLRLILPASVVV